MDIARENFCENLIVMSFVNIGSWTVCETQVKISFVNDSFLSFFPQMFP